jgi:hypothetical protein
MMGLCEVWDGRILDGMMEMSGWEEGRKGERMGGWRCGYMDWITYSFMLIYHRLQRHIPTYYLLPAAAAAAVLRVF